MTLGPLRGRTTPAPAANTPAVVSPPLAPATVLSSGATASSDTFTTGTDAVPVVPGSDPSLVDRAGNALNAYLNNRTNVTTGALSAGRVGLKGVGLLLRGMPGVGNVINAASALLSAARATVTTVAHFKGKDGVETADMVADWTRVATDIGGIFFAPVGVLGAAGDVAYRVYDVVDDHRARSTPDKPA